MAITMNIAVIADSFASLAANEAKRLLKRPVIIDGRNIFDLDRIRSLGFMYQGVG